MKVADNPDAVKPGVKFKYVGTQVMLSDPIVTAINTAIKNRIRWTVSCEYTDYSGTRTVGDFWGENLEFVEQVQESSTCTCSSRDLFAYGCKCGQMDRERKISNPTW